MLLLLLLLLSCAAVCCCSDRVQNLYIAYLFELPAVMKAAPLLTSYDYNTGLPEEDAHTRQLVTQLVGAAAAAVLSLTLLCGFTASRPSDAVTCFSWVSVCGWLLLLLLCFVACA